MSSENMENLLTFAVGLIVVYLFVGVILTTVITTNDKELAAAPLYIKIAVLAMVIVAAPVVFVRGLIKCF